jgi:hypothetical protein
VSEAIDGGRRRALRGEQHGKRRAAGAVAAEAPSSAEDALALLPQDLEAVSLSAEPTQLLQLPPSANKLVARSV